MIPKLIHYCWFGRGEKNEKARMCLASWQKMCPDYEIIEWNEDNFDVHMNAYTEMCYNERRFAHLSDYARLLILRDNGGLYFDVDVEILRPFDSLLDAPAFFGFEGTDHVNTGCGCGAEAHNPAIEAMIRRYDSLLDGQHGVIGCPILNTQALTALGLTLDGTRQDLGCAVVYPNDWFNPYDDTTGWLDKTRNTYSIHWYAKSWWDKKYVLRNKLTKPLHRLQKRRQRRAAQKAAQKDHE